MKPKCLPHGSVTAEQWDEKRKGSGLTQTPGAVPALHALAVGRWHMASQRPGEGSPRGHVGVGPPCYWPTGRTQADEKLLSSVSQSWL